ncbi:hypothetical protein [Actinoallomurus sp. NPDC050550]|uniref:hypothetical protein n=1 Tax=Actinoallomurus sp. NPDC050550 TaxID=3154937 RepID=UPI0033EA180C
MSSGDELLRSLAKFQDLLRRTPFIGASRIAEEAQLRVLIGKYPDVARQMLAELDRPDAGDD